MTTFRFETSPLRSSYTVGPSATLLQNFVLSCNHNKNYYDFSVGLKPLVKSQMLPQKQFEFGRAHTSQMAVCNTIYVLCWQGVFWLAKSAVERPSPRWFSLERRSMASRSIITLINQNAKQKKSVAQMANVTILFDSPAEGLIAAPLSLIRNVKSAILYENATFLYEIKF